MIRAGLLWCVTFGVLAGCTLAPRYERPTVAVPEHYAGEHGDWKAAEPADGTPRGAWWTRFGDAELDRLEAELSTSNQSLKAGLARLDEARAGVLAAGSALFPRINASGSATRTATSLNSPSYSATRPDITNDFMAGAALSYELDVFGRLRSTFQGARANAQAAAGDVATLELNLRAELATDYFLLRALDTEVEILDHAVADYSKALTLTENLYRGGAAAIADVKQATAQLEIAKTQAFDTQLKRAQIEHAIAVLVGRVPSTFHLPSMPLPETVRVPVVERALPSALLERRPDVAAAERRVMAANAGVGIARAAYFPVFNLTGILGRESTNRATWFEAPSRFWSVGPQALLTLFDAGQHIAQSRAARAALEEQIANYRNTVLVAFQDVEDNLSAVEKLELEHDSAMAAAAATQAALDQANYRYKAGIVTYLEVVSAENAALSAKLTLASIDSRRVAATVLLIRALGGDWQGH
jgi:NodT family efflux transporter outer membrane factor (OMF) lipoprotein